MTLQEGTLIWRLQVMLDTRSHGSHRWTSFDASGVATRKYADGFTRDYESKPPEKLRDCPRCGRAALRKRDKMCYQCSGEVRLTSAQRAYMSAAETFESDAARRPHCDSNVLHAADDCWACALPEYAPLHALRESFRIAHTDELVSPGWSECPSAAWRSPEKINRWGGNRAEKRPA